MEQERFTKCPNCGQEVLETALRTHQKVFCPQATKNEPLSASPAEPAAAALKAWEPINFASTYKLTSKLASTVMFLEGDCVQVRKLDWRSSVPVILSVDANVGVKGVAIDPRSVPQLDLLAFGTLGEDVTYHVPTSTHGTARRQVVPNTTPSVPSTTTTRLTIIEGTIRKYLKATMSAVSQDASRPVLTCAQLEFCGNKARFVSADGFRVVITPWMAASNEVEGTHNVLIAQEAMKVIPALIPKGDIVVEELEDEAGSRWVSFYSPDRPQDYVMCQEYAGQFPDYEAAVARLSGNSDTCFECTTKSLKQILKTFGNKEYREHNSLNLFFSERMTSIVATDGTVELREYTYGNDTYPSGEHVVKVDGAKVLNSPEVGRVAVNSSYLGDALLAGDNAVVKFDSDGKHVILIETELSCWLMPMYDSQRIRAEAEVKESEGDDATHDDSEEERPESDDS